MTERLFKIAEETKDPQAAGSIVPWGRNPNSLYACPWLEARATARNVENKDGFWEEVDTLIIMQDWGCLSEREKFADAVESVSPFFDQGSKFLEQKAAEDTTFRNLWKEIQKGTLSGKIALTNAIWGLRTGKSKTGYLGSNAHKVWFSNWVRVVDEFLQSSDSKDKKIIFCGEWARDWGAKEFTKLEPDGAKKYLEKYFKWANEPPILHLLNSDFEINFLRHPSASGKWVPHGCEGNLETGYFVGIDSFKW